MIRQEQQLRFLSFKNAEALAFARAVEDVIALKNLKPVAVRVVFDDVTILDYRTTGRTSSGWLTRKVHTVLESEHSSLYTFFHSQETPFSQWKDSDEYAICGGGFPLYVNNTLRGVFAVSGLDHEEDHLLLVTALEKVLEQSQKKTSF
ncbi:hypothetical protein FC19_GL001995 [Liquorilactobacillus aquaticus DSM 21051]|uniref:Heme-degrading domain-containing protein n=1 Tax=Liquorilactobacillus aquaticus DSM 21051 TaxID=1423725 RepID=A0A0R2CUE0_9LACO|nr:hypothetical protein FC19_GL001995 [Liquorilactobacillus aquaticus DSM 21051]